MLDDEAIQRATALVHHQDDFCGTAWLASPGLAITAAHVVADLATRTPKAARFELLFFDIWVNGLLDALEIDYVHDVAILSIGEMDRVAGVRPIPLAACGHARAGQSWAAYGSADGHPSGLWLRDVITSLSGWTDEGIPAMQLATYSAAVENLKGMSGAAVLVGGVALAIVREFPVRMPGQHIVLASRLDHAARTLSRLAELISAGDQSRSHQLASTFDGYCNRLIGKWNEIPYQGMFASHNDRSTLPPLATIYVQQPFRRGMTLSRVLRSKATGESENTTVEFCLLHYRNMLFQGDAGSGKTCMLRNLCVQLASDWLMRRQRRFLPAYVSAQSLVAAKRDGGLEDRIRDAVAVDIGITLDRGFFRQALPEDASWLFVIDGLDEIVQSDQRRLLIDQIMLEANDQTQARHLIISSRPLGDLQTTLGKELFSRFMLVPFDRSQALHLIDRWFRFYESEAGASDRFLNLVEQSALKGILETPVLLTMAMLTFLAGQTETFGTRAELYRRFIDETLDAARVRNGLMNLSPAWLDLSLSDGAAAAENVLKYSKELLEELAMYQQFQGNDRENGLQKIFDFCVANEWFIKSLRDGYEKRTIIKSLLPEVLLQSGLVRLTPEAIQFTHNTIREFLCAEYVTKHFAISSPEASDILNQWGDARWREVVLSSLAIWSGKEEARTSIMLFFDRLMSLSLRGMNFVGYAVAEGVQVKPERRAEVLARLIEAFGRWDSCAELFSVFSTPDPVPVLRQLVKEPECRRQFLTLLTAGGSGCPTALSRLLDLAFEFMSADELEEFARQAKYFWMRADSYRYLALKSDASASVSLLSAVVSDHESPLDARKKALAALCHLTAGTAARAVSRARKMNPMLRVMALVIQFENSKRVCHLLKACEVWKASVEDQSDREDTADFGSQLCANLLRAGKSELAKEVCCPSKFVLEIFRALVSKVELIDITNPFLCDFAVDKTQAFDVRVAAAEALASIGYIRDIRATLDEALHNDALPTDRRIELAGYLASHGEEGPLSELISDPSVDDWYKVKATILLATAGNAKGAHKRLSEWVGKVDMPSTQRVEIAAALIDLGDYEQGLESLQMLAADPAIRSRVIRILFDLGRPLEIENILINSQEKDDMKFGVQALTELGAFASLQRVLPHVSAQAFKEFIEEALDRNRVSESGRLTLKDLFQFDGA
jgi:hypothetical protein